MHHTMTRRTWMALAGAVLALAAQSGRAQSYPEKPVRLIVPYAPGGGVDLIARALAQKMSEAWGQAVIVDNRAGAGGNIGMELVARASPDGYTMLVMSSSIVINPALYKSLSFDPLRDFAPVSMAATAPNVMAAHPGTGIRTPRDVVAIGRAKPGTLSYATSGVGTVGHMVAELFKSVSGADITHVPYKGSGQSISDLLGGQVQLMLNAPGVLLQHVKANRLNGVAVASRARERGMEEIPTFVEAGFPSVVASNWYAVLMPAGAPPAVLGKVQSEVVRIVASNDVRQRFATSGYDASSSTPEALGSLMKTELAQWKKVAASSGAKID